MNYFLVHFDFATVHRGSRIRGGGGQLEVESELSLREIKKKSMNKEVVQLCVNFVLTKKPTYKIFMLDIKKIEPIKP